MPPADLVDVEHLPLLRTRLLPGGERMTNCICGCTAPPLTNNQLDGWADCARYILATTGCSPMLPLEVLRALWKRGGEDRALAEKLHRVTIAEVAA